MLTLKQTKMTKACPEIYKIITKSMRFDFMDKENPWYEFNCRVVRFKISDDKYETIITNLNREDFSMEEIREIYNMRWGRGNFFSRTQVCHWTQCIACQEKKTHTAGNLCTYDHV